MKKWTLKFLMLAFFLPFIMAWKPADTPKILVFSKTKGFRHGSIPFGQKALMELGKKNGFAVDTTEDASKFNDANLKNYSAIVFLSTTMDVLDRFQQADFERYIQAGGGYVGIHAAADTEYDWAWYNKLVGGQFSGHPGNSNVRWGVMKVLDKKHGSTAHLPKSWKRNDEWYSYKNFNANVKVLIDLDEKSYLDMDKEKGLSMGKTHPIAWYHEYDGGRAWYTGGGHTDESFSEPEFLQHILGGLKYAMTSKPLDYSKAYSKRPPEDNRFEMTVLGQNFNEPTEMAVFKDGRVMFLQRKGEIMLYEPKTNKIRQINKFAPYTKHEDGLMGLALDPNFDQNKWLYIFYAHPTESHNQLSRFEFNGDSVLTATEKVILKVPTQRQECCHTGGSITFDAKGLLYLSTGDNTNPFASDGYSPSDEREGRSAWDAQKSSANTNDLRGKILRIKVENDGSYTIPEGNLFPKGDALGRPEIFVMGCRNPYRISVDSKTGFVYWGEVGPDAGQDSLGRGPKGHDEVNQAKKAGFFGWPLFVGNSKAYNKYDFSAKKSGDIFNAEKPMNTSPNNTGHKQLPPAQKAFIWYPYGPSPEFPIVNVPSGSGGRNAMAGQVFYSADYQKTDNTFPDYYNGKLFIYEWMRGWVLVVTMDKNGDLQSIEPFMGNMRFSNPIDMQFGTDGSLYLIEYGNKWFAQNEEARLIKINFNAGNRKPLVKLSAIKNVGATPFAVQFSSKGTLDYDEDMLKYAWNFDGTGVKSTEANPIFTYEKAGIYNATLTVTDAKGASTTQSMEIRAGNEIPEIEIAVEGNSSFYFENKPVKYQVKVKDKEDGSMAEGKIKPEEVAVTVNYLQQGYDLTQIAQGHQLSSEITGFIVGKRLMDESTCKSCHQLNSKSIGPSYIQVAERYKKADAKIISTLAGKIIKGGGGNWGEQAMSAHPNFNADQAGEMVKYILSLGAEKKQDIKPSQGELALKEHVGKGEQGVYFVSAAYTDRGANGMPPITNQKVMVLKNPMQKASKADILKILMKYNVPQVGEVAVVGEGSQLGFKDIDLTGIDKLTIYTGSQGAGGTVEVRQGSPDGKLIGSCSVQGLPMGDATIELKEVDLGKKDLYFVVKNITNGGTQPAFAIRVVEFKAK